MADAPESTWGFEVFGQAMTRFREVLHRELGCCGPEDAPKRHEKIDRNFPMRTAFVDEEEGNFVTMPGDPDASTNDVTVGGSSSSSSGLLRSRSKGGADYTEPGMFGEVSTLRPSCTSPPIGVAPPATPTLGGISTANEAFVSLQSGTTMQRANSGDGDPLISSAGLESPRPLVERPEQQLNGSEVLYAGQWLGDVVHGRGVARWPTGEVYEGKFRNGLPHGRGFFTEADGSTYEGAWERGEKQGFGVYMHANGTMYEGQWRADVKSGVGLEVWPDGARYEGQYVNGLKHGKGVFKHEAVEYVGTFAGDLMQGQGTYTFADGRSYNGSWAAGHMSGHGRMQYPSGAYYEGEFMEDQRHGKGTFCQADGCHYMGEWVKGRKHGVGRKTDSAGMGVMERWVNGRRAEDAPKTARFGEETLPETKEVEEDSENLEESGFYA